MNDNLIFKLINKNEIKKIKLILNDDNNILNSKGPNNENPIHYACLNGNKEIIQLFLNINKNELNKLNYQNCSGYHILAKYYPQLLIYFIKKYKPLNINLTDLKGYNILITYILNNNLDKNILIELKKIGCSLLKSNNINDIAFIYKLLDEIKKYFKFNVNKLHLDMPLSFFSLFSNDLGMLKILINYNINLYLNDKRMDNLLSLSIVKKIKNL